MGNCVGGFKRRTHRIAPWKRNKPIVLCLLGIDGAGKTTIVKALQGEDFGTVHATVGFSRAELRVQKYRITVYDLGGSARIREIWPIYFAEVFGVVYVMDASAASRISENKKMVDSLVGLPDLHGKPILFLLNKKDLPEALDEMQFSERFNLHAMAKSNKTDIRVEGVCAVKGTGKEIDEVIVEGLEWLIEKVLDNYDNISKEVGKALKALKERQAQERLERQHRLALSASKESPEAVGTPVDQHERECEEQRKEERKEDGTDGEGRDENGTELEEREEDDGTVREEREEDGAGTLAQNGVAVLRPGRAANGGIDYGVFEISDLNGGGRVNEATTTDDEEGGGGGDGGREKGKEEKERGKGAEERDEKGGGTEERGGGGGGGGQRRVGALVEIEMSQTGGGTREGSGGSGSFARQRDGHALAASDF
uniref:ADP-ribosylation factor-like protein 13B n=1 Tax=Globodera rostochiensis TaxID=31243 RepID=A0A914GX87_GLORO